MKKVTVLGATGSIGRSALSVIKANSDSLKVHTLVNNSDRNGINALKEEYNAQNAVCLKENNGLDINLPDFYADSGIVVNGIAGIAGLKPTLAALQAGKTVATANKESFVCAGTLVNSYAKKFGGKIHPVDSEHSAVWRCINGSSERQIKSIILTASGGAFRDLDKSQLLNAKAEDALNHPTWKMGKKVTIDCATLINKGMEIIEAKHLFGGNVKAVLHRESIIHALVEFSDNSLKADLSCPDMSLPIQYALMYPDCGNLSVKPLDFETLSALTFGKIDEERFPCFKIAKLVAEKSDFYGTVLAAADEALVELYLDGRIGFYDISDGILSALETFVETKITCAEEVIRIANAVKEYIKRNSKY